METVKRIAGLACLFGGEPHSGWLPPGAAIPLPTPIREVLLDIEIQYDASGYLLCYSSPDGSVVGDTWHPLLADAEETATQDFGVQLSQWKNA
jgi:hypothetical protein